VTGSTLLENGTPSPAGSIAHTVALWEPAPLLLGINSTSTPNRRYVSQSRAKSANYPVTSPYAAPIVSNVAPAYEIENDHVFGFEQNYTTIGAFRFGTVPPPARIGTTSNRFQLDTCYMPFMVGAELVWTY